MARITSREAIDHFIGFVVSASITTLLTVFAIWRRKPWITRLRLLTVFPLGVSASIPAYLHINLKGFFTRAWRDSDARARARSAYDALAIAVSSSDHLTLLLFIFGPGHPPHSLGVHNHPSPGVHEATPRRRIHRQQSPEQKAQQRLLLCVPVRPRSHVHDRDGSRTRWPEHSLGFWVVRWGEISKVRFCHSHPAGLGG